MGVVGLDGKTHSLFEIVKEGLFDFLGDIYSIPSTGGDATQLTSGMQFDAQPRYSPDGKKIIFISRPRRNKDAA